MGHIRRIGRTLIHEGRIFDYYQDTMLTETGNETVWDCIEHKGAACVVPVRDDGKILLVRQFRNPLQRESLELPAGKRDSKDEPFFDCAVRELEEETGYRSDHIELLLRGFASCIAYSSEQIDIFVAHDLIPTAQHLDDDEFIDVEAYSPEELLRMIYDGTIQDSKTVAGVMAYCIKYRKI